MAPSLRKSRRTKWIPLDIEELLSLEAAEDNGAEGNKTLFLEVYSIILSQGLLNIKIPIYRACWTQGYILIPSMAEA